jgi:hypothetical protein
MSTGRHFQNGRHNTLKIQHCPISSKFDIYVEMALKSDNVEFVWYCGGHFEYGDR